MQIDFTDEELRTIRIALSNYSEAAVKNYKRDEKRMKKPHKPDEDIFYQKLIEYDRVRIETIDSIRKKIPEM